MWGVKVLDAGTETSVATEWISSALLWPLDGRRNDQLFTISFCRQNYLQILKGISFSTFSISPALNNLKHTVHRRHREAILGRPITRLLWSTFKMLFFQAIIASLIATSLGLPIPVSNAAAVSPWQQNFRNIAYDLHQTKRDLVTLDLDPSVDVDLLNNLCIGIAVCNPVSVTDNDK